MKAVIAIVSIIALGLLTSACGANDPPTPTAASVQATATMTSLISADVIVKPSDIRLDTQGLPYSWQAIAVPETPFDTSQPPGPKGMPAHIAILFGATSLDNRQPNTPIMYIIPVDAYKKMWDDAGNPLVSTTLDKITKYSATLPDPPPTAGLPALPPEEVGGGTNDLAAQVGRAEHDDKSATQSGFRFVGRWQQNATPVTNQGMRYIYQGYTTNNQYLVAFFYPVSTSKLPNSVAEVPANEMAQFNADPQAYIKQQAEMLSGLKPSDWDPDLTKLDKLVGSLQIEGMPAP